MRKILWMLICFALFATVAGCSASAGEDGAFPLPEKENRIEGTAVYNGMDLYDGIEYGMTFEEYISLVNDRFGEQATETAESLSYDSEGNVVDGNEWTCARTFVYNEEFDMNTVIKAEFLNGTFNGVWAYSLSYCEDFGDFKNRTEFLEKNAQVLTEDFSTRGTSGSGQRFLVEVEWNDEVFDKEKDMYVRPEPFRSVSYRFVYLPEYQGSEEQALTGGREYETYSYDPGKVMYSELRMGTSYDAETFTDPGHPEYEFDTYIPNLFVKK